jgi:pyrroline-5-carboxylate reductase
MLQLQNKIGFIGAGNMGEAIIGALIRSGTIGPSQIFIYEIRKEQVDALKKNYGITVLNDITEIINTCDVIIFAIKPQSIDPVLSGIEKSGIFRQLHDKKLIISIVAGTKIKKFENCIYSTIHDKIKSQFPIIRVMPNTPALVGEGMSGLCANSVADSNDIRIAKTLLLAMGKVLECEEKDMDAVTAVSGSGPAYCFYFVEAMIEAAKKLGFTPESAANLTITTFKGALSLLEHQKESPEQLRRKVTSPGGTTEAAIKVLEEHNVKPAIIKAVHAAAGRSRELSA